MKACGSKQRLCLYLIVGILVVLVILAYFQEVYHVAFWKTNTVCGSKHDGKPFYFGTTDVACMRMIRTRRKGRLMHQPLFQTGSSGRSLIDGSTTMAGISSCSTNPIPGGQQRPRNVQVAVKPNPPDTPGLTLNACADVLITTMNVSRNSTTL